MCVSRVLSITIVVAVAVSCLHCNVWSTLTLSVSVVAHSFAGIAVRITCVGLCRKTAAA